MRHAGRKPQGPALVRHLDGSEQAKARLEVILATIAGELTIEEACERLDIKPARFFHLRNEVLAAGLKRLEPRPLGRPAQHPGVEEQRCQELQEQVAQLQDELKIAAVREEVAHVLSHRDAASPVKKTTAGKGRKPRPRRWAR